MAKNFSKSRRPLAKPAVDIREEALWIYGLNPVWECLRAHPQDIVEIFCGRDDPRAQAVLQLAIDHNIPVSTVDRRSLSDRLGHDDHQGMAARLKAFRYQALETLLTRPEPGQRPLVFLDGLQDPHNLGAIVRSACFLGADAVILPKDRSVPVTGAVYKASAGALAYLPVIQVTNLVRAMKQLKASGYWMVGLDVQGPSSIYDLEYNMPVGLVVGGEATGLRPLVKKTCDFLVKIPGTGSMQSLNASVAAAVALAEIRRQQRRFGASLHP